MVDPGVTDRALGPLLGLATGDAVGTTLEFSTRDQQPPLTDMVGGGPFGLAPGVWTDDTSMALALAESLVANGALDEVDLMDRFLAWWRDGEYSVTGVCFDIGMTTAGALRRFERSRNPIAGETSADTAGNGSLMRLAPVMIWGVSRSEADMRWVARRQSTTTHGAPACLDACEGFSLLVRDLILGATFEDALHKASTIAAQPEIARIFAGSWRSKNRDQIASSGYVVHSLEAALWCVANSRSFSEAILLAANLGDDADTTAAITGQAAGALYGRSGIPQPWLERLAWRERLERAGLSLLTPAT